MMAVARPTRAGGRPRPPVKWRKLVRLWSLLWEREVGRKRLLKVPGLRDGSVASPY